MSAKDDNSRPFRIWDSVEKRFVRWRYYKTLRRAMDSALLIVRWEKVGRTLEVLDDRTGKHHGTYARKLDSISFTRPTALNGKELAHRNAVIRDFKEQRRSSHDTTH